MKILSSLLLVLVLATCASAQVQTLPNRGNFYPIPGDLDVSGLAAFEGDVTFNAKVNIVGVITVTDTTKVANLNADKVNSITLVKQNVTLSPAEVGANTCAEEDFAVSSAATGDVVVVNKPTAQAGLGLGGARVSSAGHVAINFCNVTAAPITPTASQSYSFGFIR